MRQCFPNGGWKGKKLQPFSKKEVVNLTPEQHQEYKRYSFDSYVKRALKREAWAGYYEIKRKLSREVSLEDLPEDAMEELAVTDFYPWEHRTFCVADVVIVVKNETLAYALERLSTKDRDIILMHWFLDMADSEIAYQLHIARRTVNDRRRKSYKRLKEWMSGEAHEQKYKQD